MRLKRIIRSKRALSPVVTTVFLFAIIIGAIAVSLGIIFPAVNELTDQIEIESASAQLIDLDDELKQLILNNVEGKITKTIDLGSGATLFGDNMSTSILILGELDDTGTFSVLGTNPSQINLTQHRIVMKHDIAGDNIARNSNSYLSGTANQNFYYLNITNKANTPWEVLNQSRFGDDNVYTSLSYRNIITANQFINPANLELNLTVTIQRVNFNFLDKMTSDSTSPSLVIEYKGQSVITYDWAQIVYNPGNPQSFAMKAITNLWDVNGAISQSQTNNETPFSFEVPEDGVLNVRIRIISHIVDFDMN